MLFAQQDKQGKMYIWFKHHKFQLNLNLTSILTGSSPINRHILCPAVPICVLTYMFVCSVQYDKSIVMEADDSKTKRTLDLNKQTWSHKVRSLIDKQIGVVSAMHFRFVVIPPQKSHKFNVWRLWGLTKFFFQLHSYTRLTFAASALFSGALPRVHFET